MSDTAEVISKELEMSMLNEPPAFTGSDGAEAEVFIQCIRKRAFDQVRLKISGLNCFWDPHAERLSLVKGKQDDNRWIAQYAATCFIKEALRWFEDLDEEMQNDWRLLRKAMLAKWPAPGGRKSTSSTARHKSPSPCPRYVQLPLYGKQPSLFDREDVS